MNDKIESFGTHGFIVGTRQESALAVTHDFIPSRYTEGLVLGVLLGVILSQSVEGLVDFYRRRREDHKHG